MLLATSRLFRPSASSASRASTRPHLAYLQVMYASSCQLPAVNYLILSYVIINDVISTGVVWCCLIATRTFWPFVVIRSPIAYV